MSNEDLDPRTGHEATASPSPTPAQRRLRIYLSDPEDAEFYQHVLCIQREITEQDYTAPDVSETIAGLYEITGDSNFLPELPSNRQLVATPLLVKMLFGSLVIIICSELYLAYETSFAMIPKPWCKIHLVSSLPLCLPSKDLAHIGVRSRPTCRYFAMPEEPLDRPDSGAGLGEDMIRVENATLFLVKLVRNSSILSRDILADALLLFGARAKRAQGELQLLGTRFRKVIDRVTSEHHLRVLLLAAESPIRDLYDLQGSLHVIQIITTFEESSISRDKHSLLSQLQLTMLGTNQQALRQYYSHLAVLDEVFACSRHFLDYFASTLQTLQEMSVRLGTLRTQVVERAVRGECASRIIQALDQATDDLETTRE